MGWAGEWRENTAGLAGVGLRACAACGLDAEQFDSFDPLDQLRAEWFKTPVLSMTSVAWAGGHTLAKPISHVVVHPHGSGGLTASEPGRATVILPV